VTHRVLIKAVYDVYITPWFDSSNSSIS